VSEVDTYGEIDPDLREGIAFGTAEELPRLCRSLLDDDARRLELAERGFEIYRRRDFTAAVGNLLAARAAATSPLPGRATL
jgi:hypothetical protein